MTLGPVRGRGLLEIPGIGLGHAGQLSRERLTGTTVIVPPAGATVGVDVRGGGPATHETDVIAPGTHSYGADAIVLTGGSALGLRSVSGVVTALAEAGRGFPAAGLPDTVIPIVPAAAIFDLGRGDAGVLPPTVEEGAEAARDALAVQSSAEELGSPAGSAPTHSTSQGPLPAVRGSIGAGTGARSGFQSLRSSMGSFAIRLPGGLTVAALVIANSLGTLGTSAGSLWARTLLHSYGLDLPELDHLPAPPETAAADATPTATSARNTTIAVVATNAALDTAQVTRMASGAHAGIARAVHPSHTLYDGDTVFGLATGTRALPTGFSEATRELVTITAAAADALSLAILDAHVSAAPTEGTWGQPPTLSDIAPEFVEAFTALP